MQVASVVRGPGWALAIGAFATTMLMAQTPLPTTHASREIQTAVTADGFAVSETIDGGRRVTELTRDGATRSGTAFKRAGDVRVIGSTSGVLAVYEEGRRIRLTRVSDGKDAGMFGTSVRKLCEGIASNDSRSGVGWFESDGKFWFVHGPTRKARTQDAELEVTQHDVGITTALAKDWCGIASAEAKIALLWQENDRLLINMCTAKKCASLPGSAKIPSTTLILGVGCLRNACLVATRDRTGKTAMSLVTESGSIKWSQALEVTGTAVSIVGVGDRGFAVGVGNQVLRVDRAGKQQTVWTGPASTSTPQLSWSEGRLLVARDVGGTLTTQTIELR